jgi:hypothetical protein
MANVYAIKTGNWSDPTVWNTGALPTSADDVFSNNFTVTIDQNVNVLSIRNTAQSPAVAGGGFVISSSTTVTCTGSVGMQSSPATLVTVSAAAGNTVSINSNIYASSTTNSITTIVKTGACSLNITGEFYTVGGGNRDCLNISATGTVTVVGNLRASWSNCTSIRIPAAGAGCVLNVVGDLNPSKALNNAQNEQVIVVSAVCTINITGNIYGGWGNSVSLSIGAAASVYVTGNVYGGVNTSAGNGNAISSASAGLINVIGIVSAQHTASYETAAVVSTSASAINLLSGPFVSGPYGTAPFLCVRMHLIPNAASYFEFRDETTNGAVSPGAIAPVARLVQPGYAVDAPTPNNVRAGTVYASGTLTGTCQIPAAAAVAFGVAVDNTTGTAVMSPSDVWNIPVSSLTTFNSIGARVKNAATEQSVGQIITAFN